MPLAAASADLDWMSAVLDMLVKLGQYGALGTIVAASIYGVYRGAVAVWKMIIDQNVRIEGLQRQMMEQSDRHAGQLQEMHSQQTAAMLHSATAVENNTKAVERLVSRIDNVEQRVEKVESGLRRAVTTDDSVKKLPTS